MVTTAIAGEAFMYRTSDEMNKTDDDMMIAAILEVMTSSIEFTNRLEPRKSSDED